MWLSGSRCGVRAAVALTLTLALGSGCAMPKTAVYKSSSGQGQKFCADIANHAQLISTQEMGAGTFLFVMGGASVTASGVLSTIVASSNNVNRELFGYLAGGLAIAPLIAKWWNW